MSETISFKKATLEELSIIMDRGAKARALMADEGFFKTVVLAEIEKEIGEIEAGLVWAPGSTEKSVEKIALDRVWKSGILFGIGKIWGTLNRLKNEAAEAEKEYSSRGEK